MRFGAIFLAMFCPVAGIAYGSRRNRPNDFPTGFGPLGVWQKNILNKQINSKNSNTLNFSHSSYNFFN
jgi:hypothetical protein